MFTINRKTITMTRGDSAELQLSLKKNGSDFFPSEGDVIVFRMSKSYESLVSYQLLIEKTIPNETLVLTLDPEDTDEVPYGSYNYDIELTYEDGSVDTFVSDKFILTGECG